MKYLSLFSGIAGGDLAAKWAGWEVQAFCERDEYCQKVLNKNFPSTPVYDDVCTLTKGRLEQDGLGTIDAFLVSDPCQPYSVAGEREGTADDRALWPEVNRLLEEIRPRWVVRENVAGNITLGLDELLSDLENLGYTWGGVVIPASAVGALHRRDRLFIIAHSDSEHVAGHILQTIQGEQTLQREFHHGSVEEWARRSQVYEPKLLRTFNGLPHQVDRIIALGNAIVPQHIYPILAIIKQIDDVLNPNRKD